MQDQCLTLGCIADVHASLVDLGLCVRPKFEFVEPPLALPSLGPVLRVMSGRCSRATQIFFWT